METLKTVTRQDPFWKALREECDKSLKDYEAVTGQNIDKEYEEFKTKLTQALTTTLEKTQPLRTVLKARIKSNQELKQLRTRKHELYCEVKAEREKEKREILKAKVVRVNRRLKTVTRSVINHYKREQIKEIEELEYDDCRRMCG